MSAGTIAIRLAYRSPFRFDAIAKFHADRGTSFGDVTIVWDRHSCLSMTVPTSQARDIHDLVVRARRTFDLAADPIAIDEHLSQDKFLRPLLAKRPGPRVPGAWDPFEVAVRAIVGQQISVRGATTIMKRCFPTFQWSGMPQSRIDTIKRLADNRSILVRGASLDETIERLTAIRGIGPWTAHYIAMRALAEPDAFPHSDLGLRKAAAAIGIEPSKLLDHAERWRPWRAYAAIALWESL